MNRPEQTERKTSISELINPDFREISTRAADEAETVAAPSSLESPISAPFSDSSRYEILELLGVGGMGRVYKARDRLLSRYVALKFVRDEDPTLLRRFLREAQAQAALDHENICKVFEVGQREGKIYIAMQYIEGASLKALKKKLRSEQKIEIVQRIAEALHVAHRKGLIHRDIKPANIMVEQREGGALHPYLMDFGLARDIAAPGQTQTGAIEGTPAYMPPEQVFGAIRELDRRSDVYALGATLYDIFAGRPPFIGETSLEIMLETLHQEPTPLRSIDATIPADIETIVAKCLEKSPARRYESARALADDLGRFLDGEPVLARPASLAYRLATKARKHRAILAVAAIALFVAILQFGLFVQAKAASAKQAEYARAIGQDIKEIELFMHYALALPVHEIEREHQVIRERMKTIEARMQSSGEGALGPSCYALGRAYFLLDDPAAAEAQLEKAIASGFSGPDVELALGRARVALYSRALADARRMGDAKLREKREKEAEEKYLSRALAHFRSSEGASDISLALIQANIAFLEKRYSDAARLAGQAARQTPWQVEPLAMLGHARLGQARSAFDRGALGDAATTAADAVSAFEVASTMARSDANVADALADAWALRVDIDRAAQKPYASFATKSVEACDLAIQIAPKRVSAHRTRARMLFLSAKMPQLNDKASSDGITSAMKSAENALALDENDAVTLDIVGNIHVFLASMEIRNGGDPRKHFELAKQSLERAASVDPRFAWPVNDLGNAHYQLALYEINHGLDPNPTCDRAVEHYRAAQARDPDYTFPYENHAEAEALRAMYLVEHGLDPRHLLARVTEACTRKVNGDAPRLRCEEPMLNVQLQLLEYEIRIGRHPGALFDEVFTLLNETIRARPLYYGWYLGLARAHTLKAQWLLRDGNDISTELSAARAAIQKAPQFEGENDAILLAAADIEIAAAKQRSASAKQVSASIRDAEELINKAIQLSAFDPAPRTRLAEVFYLQITTSRATEKNVEKALDAAERALTLNPRNARALFLRGALHLERARLARSTNQSDAFIKKSRADLDAAVRENPLLEAECKPLRMTLDKLRGND